MPIYPTLVRPLLFLLDPERTHRRAIRLGHRLSRSASARALLRLPYDWQSPALAVDALGLRFRNPVGLAAGFDKHAEIHRLVPDLGFGHMEIGSVSVRPWRGNPSPTLLRLPRDHGLINRLGLNSEGLDAVLPRIQPADHRIPTGLNLVKTADPAIDGDEAIDDYLRAFERAYPAAAFITLNLSCPNTAEGRTFEEPAVLDPFLRRLQPLRARLAAAGARMPVFVKISPDLAEPTLARILELSEHYGIDGYVIGNTTTRREGLRTAAEILTRFGYGGVSGFPLTPFVQDMVRRVRRRIPPARLIIAVGGIGCDPSKTPAEEVWRYLTLGATLVQVHTGLIYQGPSLVRRINRGLVRLLQRHGFDSLEAFFSARDR